MSPKKPNQKKSLCCNYAVGVHCGEQGTNYYCCNRCGLQQCALKLSHPTPPSMEGEVGELIGITVAEDVSPSDPAPPKEPCLSCLHGGNDNTGKCCSECGLTTVFVPNENASPPQKEKEHEWEDRIDEVFGNEEGENDQHFLNKRERDFIKSFIRTLLEQAYERGRNERQITDEVPMGISQWQNHGKKFGYFDYYKTTAEFAKVVQATRADERERTIREIREKMKKNSALKTIHYSSRKNDDGSLLELSHHSRGICNDFCIRKKTVNELLASLTQKPEEKV